MTSHIPDKGQVMVRYCGLCANAHRGKVRKASLPHLALRIVDEELRPVASKGWAARIRKVYEFDPMVCPKCGGAMRVVAFLPEHAVVDRIIDHLKLTFVADRPPPHSWSQEQRRLPEYRPKRPPQAAFQEYLVEADPPGDYFYKPRGRLARRPSPYPGRP